MTRREREITDPAEIKAILNGCTYLHLGLVDDGVPYVVPMNYGVVENQGDSQPTIYLHSGMTGRKLDIIRKNSKCCFTLERDILPFEGEVACQYGMAYQCLMGFGNIYVVEDVEEKKRALSALMFTQTGKEFTFDDRMTTIVTVMRIDVEEITAKRRELPAKFTSQE